MKHSCMLAAIIGLITLSTALAGPNVRYRCADGTRLAAAFDNRGTGSVKLFFGRSAPPLTLPQAMSADGGRYADQKAEFWIKGRGATLTRNGHAVACNAR
jgi:membrane-bound inhibitor of C-type lysozyme